MLYHAVVSSKNNCLFILLPVSLFSLLSLHVPVCLTYIISSVSVLGLLSLYIYIYIYICLYICVYTVSACFDCLLACAAVSLYTAVYAYCLLLLSPVSFHYLLLSPSTICCCLLLQFAAVSFWVCLFVSQADTAQISSKYLIYKEVSPCSYLRL